MMKLKATGARGSWFAIVDGEQLPCVHNYWWVKPASYHDKDLKLDDPKAGPFFDEISSKKRVILTTGNPSFDPSGIVSGFERTGYVAVYAIDNVVFDKLGLKFD